MGRRFVAILIDWFASTFVAGLSNHDALPFSGHPSYLPLLVFGLEVWILTATTGASFGQRLVRLRVVSLDGRPLNPVRAFVRTVLLCLAVPALIWDRDLRGLHDKAANTVVVRA